MATVEENAHYWENVYDWGQAGEEWSLGWGSTKAKWHQTLMPRLRRFLPATNILEIATGYGRLTEYLMDYCDHLVGVDISPKCIDHCQKRFPELEFFVNDGQSLEMVQDDSIDFVFSYFSLIHAEVDTVSCYLHEIAKKLKNPGAGFLHHSNLGQFERYFRHTQKLPKPVQRLLFECGLLDLPQWRAPSMSAVAFERCCEEAGLVCITQETVNFGSHRTIDCFSTFVTPDHPLARENKVWHNKRFMHEAMDVRLEGKATSLPTQYYGN